MKKIKVAQEGVLEILSQTTYIQLKKLKQDQRSIALSLASVIQNFSGFKDKVQPNIFLFLFLFFWLFLAFLVLVLALVLVLVWFWFWFSFVLAGLRLRFWLMSKLRLNKLLT